MLIQFEDSWSKVGEQRSYTCRGRGWGEMEGEREGEGEGEEIRTKYEDGQDLFRYLQLHGFLKHQSDTKLHAH